MGGRTELLQRWAAAAASVVVVVVVVVMMTPSASAYMGRQMPRIDEEFHQIHVVTKYVFDVSAVTEIMLTFCFPPWV